MSRRNMTKRHVRALSCPSVIPMFPAMAEKESITVSGKLFHYLQDVSSPSGTTVETFYVREFSQRSLDVFISVVPPIVNLAPSYFFPVPYREYYIGKRRGAELQTRVSQRRDYDRRKSRARARARARPLSATDKESSLSNMERVLETVPELVRDHSSILWDYF